MGTLGDSTALHQQPLAQNNGHQVTAQQLEGLAPKAINGQALTSANLLGVLANEQHKLNNALASAAASETPRNGVDPSTQNQATMNGHAHTETPSPTESIFVENAAPVAVIGMSCRFPGDSSNPERLWELCAQAREAWSEWPADRFNQSSFYHPNPERGGTFNAKGGHFISQDMGAFDASFFNITPTEAKALDPQQRLQLESTYEALENAGIPLEKVCGSNTSVYIGTSNHDYERMLWKDPDSLPLYHAVGVSASIMANRISYFFDLRGPSVTIDTACSSSLVALHQACQSLRQGESKQAIVGGTNLILEPGMLIPMSSLRFFSPDGMCYTYDHRASGYGRGEGVGTVILKPLDAAIRDGDTIRAVVRATGVNSDGRTAGLMLPNGDAQEALIRSTYASAGLDPAYTRYVEAHGTGTKAGDPLESGALGRVFGAASRAAGTPTVRVGSVKTNIGHLENASGIAGLIKTILSVEKSMILPNSNFQKPGDRVLLDEWNLKVPTQLESWPADGPKRASINSFGFGGTNAHAVVDDAVSYLKSIKAAGHTAQAGRPVDETDETVAPRLYVLSANDEHTSKLLAETYATHLRSTAERQLPNYGERLAYTLQSRRSLLPWREAIVASDLADLAEKLSSDDFAPVRSSTQPKIGFVFTGQGAQWCGMGRELLDVYPVFKATMDAADKHLRSLGASWSLTSELLRDKETSRIGLASISQPICTAIQLGIVNLLASWGVRPAAVVGHSSGEIAAAYTVGALTLESAMAVAYYRGLAMENLKINEPDLRGGMLAAGLAATEANKLAMSVKSGEVTVACINSPSSVTISGDDTAIDEMAKLLEERKIFNRRLKVEVAYHSHHMSYASNEYLLNMLKGPSLPDGAMKEKDIVFSSSLSARLAHPNELTQTYWVRNMVSPVHFSEALAAMVAGEQAGAIDTIVEIGPHSTLAGPVKQTLTALELNAKIGYQSTLIRNENACLSLLNTAAALWKASYPIDMNAVNRLQTPELRYGPLTDLPPYPFNHTTKHWHESRLSKDYRFRKEPRHDLLGDLSPDSNPIEPKWRNLLRAPDIPWVKDHVVQSTLVYPASGYLAMAIEAARQRHAMSPNQDKKLKDVRLKNICLSSALVIPSGESGVETSVALRPSPDGDKESSSKWLEFRIFSYAEGKDWTEHCRGLITIEVDGAVDEDNSNDQYWQQKTSSAFSDCTTPFSTETLYETFENMGLLFGPTFQNLDNVLVGSDGNAACTIKIPDTAATMPYQTEHPNIIHPAVLDACFQAAFPPVIEGGRLRDPMVPTFIDELFINADIARQTGSQFKAYASAKSFILRSCVSDISVFDAGAVAPTQPMVLVTGLRTTSLSWGGAASAQLDSTRKICYAMPWVPDVDLMDSEVLGQLWPAPEPSRQLDSAQSLAVLEWLSHEYIKEALSQVTDADIEKMAKHHKQFYEWARTLTTLPITTTEENAALPEAYPILELEDSEAKKQAAVKFAQGLGPEGEVVLRIGQSLLPILKGEVDPLGVLVQGGLLNVFYTEDRSMLRCYELLREYTTTLSQKDPNMRILEIGAGTGGATEPFLQALGGGSTNTYPRFGKYTYTDISSAFFEKARVRFAAWDGMIEYRTLDVERNLDEQGYEEGTYDLIIAANVLHATKSMDVTMSNVRRLLKPGGRLVMIEITNPRLRICLPFGMLPGWWLGEGDGREAGPLLRPKRWEEVLKRNGFDGLTICESDYPGTYEMSSLLVSRASEEIPAKQTTVQIVGPSVPNAVVQTLSEKLGQIGHQVEVRSWDQPEQWSASPCIVLDLNESGLLANLEEPDFNKARQILNKCDNVMWVTSEGHVNKPDAAMVTGLARTLRNENAALRFVTLDISADTLSDASSTASTLAKVFVSRLNGKSDAKDLELVERAGQIKVPRLVEHTELNDLLARDVAGVQRPPQTEPFYQEGRPLRLQIGTPGLLDSLHFADVEYPPQLDEDSVEFEVKAIGLNFRDVLTVLGQIENPYPLGYDSSGIITAVGSNVQGFAVGDKVAALAVGSFTSVHRVKAHNVFHLPTGLSFEDGASIPLAFATAYHALVDVAKVSEGQQVLIHSAAGGVGQAAVKLAQLAGAEVFVTVGSDEKRQIMLNEYKIPASHIFSSRNSGFAEKIMRMTDGKGVEVVLNSLAGELLKETWNCIGMFGYFLEVGKRDIYANTRLDMRPFDKHVTFSAIDLSAVFDHRPLWGAKILGDCFKLFHENKVTVMKPIISFPIDQIEAAFRFMQAGKHSGKIVVTVPEKVEVLVAPREVRFLSNKGTYLIAGGSGGLGREICRWMISNGAQYIALLSRSGIEGNVKAQELVDEAAAEGATVKVYKCDTQSAEQLAQVVRDIEAEHLPPVRGVINGAMILRDSFFENMKFQDWKAVANTKLLSTWNLHKQFLQDPLDFFICLSSAAGVSGNRGQSNYAASSSFQDAFARFRRSLGLPATTLDLGMIEDAGYVADNKDSVAYLRSHGFGMIKLQELFTMLRHAILTGASASETQCQIVSGYDATAAEHAAAGNASSGIGLTDPKFSHLPGIHLAHGKGGSDNADGSNAKTISLKQALLSTDQDKRLGVLSEAVTARLASLLGKNVDDVSEKKSIAALGVDSLVAVELRNWIVGETAVSLPIFEILSAQSLLELSQRIMSGCAWLSEEGEGAGEEKKEEDKK